MVTKECTSGRWIGVHLHLLWIDQGIDDHPRSTSKLGKRRDVNQDWLIELSQAIDNFGAKFDNLKQNVKRQL